MAMQTSTTPIFYPDLCPNCSNYDSTGQKCMVAAVAAGSTLPSEVMISEMTGLCPYFEPVASRPTINEVEAVEVQGNVGLTAEEPPLPTREEPVEKAATEAAMPLATEMEVSPGEADAIIEPAAATPFADIASLDEAAQVVAEAEGAVPPELQASIPIEQAARIVSMPATIEQPTTVEPTPVTKERPTMPGNAPAVEARLPGEARIHCPKCKVENTSNAVRCQNCGELLLPGENTRGKPVYFVFGVLFAAAFAYLYYQFYILNPGTTLENGIFSPLILGAFVSLLLGIFLSLRRAPEYLKYEARASRHIPLNALQSLADANRAIAISPEREHNRLLKMRAEIYDKLGMAEAAARDRLAVITSPKATRADANLVYPITGAEADLYAMGRRKDQMKAVLSSGNVVAVGYCPRCRLVAELNADESCKVHPKIKGQDVDYVIAADALKGKLSVLGKIERRHQEAAAQLTGMLAQNEAAAVGYCPKCRKVVQLDVERKCIVHPKQRGKWVHYTVPGELEQGKQAVLEEMKKRTVALRDLRNALMVVIVLVVLLLAYVLTR